MNAASGTAEYQKGYQGFHEGKRVHPYIPGSTKAAMWIQGYNDALDDAPKDIVRLKAELANLKQWKEEAIEEAVRWFAVSDEIGGKGTIGERLTDIAIREVRRLKAVNAELLAACEKMLAKFDSIRPEWSDETPMCREARAAIAKAKGTI